MEARLLQREADALAFRVGREKQWLATHKRELRRIQGRLRELSALTSKVDNGTYPSYENERVSDLR